MLVVDKLYDLDDDELTYLINSIEDESNELYSKVWSKQPTQPNTSEYYRIRLLDSKVEGLLRVQYSRLGL